MRVAVIPARGGSARIPGKNIRRFAGKPIIAWPIAAAHACGLFDHIVVSTDSEEIADIARSFGADIPFMRPAALADDAASTDAVLAHALTMCIAEFGHIEYACCLYPTAALVNASDIAQGLALLTTHRATSAFPVVAYDFPIEQAFTLEGVRPRPRWPEALDMRSQDLGEHYHDAATFYWVDVARFLDEPRLFGEDSVAFAVPASRAQDINTPEDWGRAELKFQLLQSERVQ